MSTYASCILDIVYADNNSKGKVKIDIIMFHIQPSPHRNCRGSQKNKKVLDSLHNLKQMLSRQQGDVCSCHQVPSCAGPLQYLSF